MEMRGLGGIGEELGVNRNRERSEKVVNIVNIVNIAMRKCDKKLLARAGKEREKRGALWVR